MTLSHLSTVGRAARAALGSWLPVALCLTAVAAPRAAAGIIHVPADQPTVQAAIVAAAGGDTILVAPGTYHERIDFLGKKLTVIGESGAAATVLDGTGLGGSVVTIASAASNGSLLQGFTITGGTGNNDGTGWYGGGVDLVSTSTVSACVITGNHIPPAGQPGKAMGGGVYVRIGTVRDCTITGNSAIAQDGYVGQGGGVGSESSYGEQSLVIDCTIEGNSARFGGGVAGATPTGCLIEGNVATHKGGGYFATYFVALQALALPLRHCTFRGNSAGVYGGGAYVVASTFPEATSAAAWDCLFADNDAPTGDGLYIGRTIASVPPAAVSLCTFVHDGVRSDWDLQVDSCIFHEVAAPAVATDPLAILSVRYCDVPGGFPGIGNIDADPLFVDAPGGDFHLTEASPCRNKGNPSLPQDGVHPNLATDTDIDGEPRVIEGRLEMGIDEISPDCNGNGLPDYVDLANGTSADCDANAIPDECEPFTDCNGNGQFDACDIATGLSSDCNANHIPDECEPFVDCNGNGQFDACDIADGTSTDYNANGLPDECEELPDCDANGVPDLIDVALGHVPDCNGNGVPDSCDLASGTSADINGNGVPDECQGLVFVPRDAPTIQAGLALAGPLGTVVVSPGTYGGPGNTEIVFPWNNQILMGQSGAAACILDGGNEVRFFDLGDSEDSAGITIRDLTLRHGFATSGGAVLCGTTASPLFLRCVFEENRASLGGGAVQVQGAAAPRLERCVFVRNEAANGGALRLGGSGTMLVQHGTFVDNTSTANGGTVRVTGGADVELRDCILRGGDGGNGDELAVDGAGSTLAVNFSDVAGGQAGAFVGSGGALAWGAGNLDADPHFANAAADDYHLLPGSPCINSGDPAGPADADLSPPDMGALPYSPWTDLGGGVGGSAGLPQLAVNGSLVAGQPVSFKLTHAPPLQSVTLVLGGSALGAPFKGGIFWPAASVLIPGLPTDAAGQLLLAGSWPAGLPSGFSFWTQVWFADGGAPFGFAGSNGVKGTAP